MSAGDLPPGVDPGDSSDNPNDDWRPPVPSPPPPWGTGTFAAELTRLLRRLAVWHDTDFLSPLHTVQTASEYWRLTSLTLGELIRGSDDRVLRSAFRVFSDGKEGPWGAYVIPERDTDRTATQWLLAVFCRHLERAPQLPVFDYIRGLVGQLLALPAWVALTADEIGLYGQPEGTRVLSGRPIPLHLVQDFKRAVKRLLDTPEPPAGTPAKGPGGGASVDGATAREAPGIDPTAADILARARQAGERMDRLVATIQAVDTLNTRLRDAALAYQSARGAIYEARDVRGWDFDPTPHLAGIAGALTSFCSVLRESARARLLDEVDWPATRRDLNVGLNADESEVAYQLAERMFRTALDGRPVVELMGAGWDGPDREGRTGVVLRSAVQCLGILVNMLAGELGFKRRPLAPPAALELARDLRGRYGRMDDWSPADLSRMSLDLDTLDRALETFHVELPRPNKWQDTAAYAMAKCDRIIGALEQLTGLEADARASGGMPPAASASPSLPLDPTPEGTGPTSPAGAVSVVAGGQPTALAPPIRPATPADFARLADTLRDLNEALRSQSANGARVSSAWDAILRRLGATDKDEAAKSVMGLSELPEVVKVSLIELLDGYGDIYHRHRLGQSPEDFTAMAGFRVHLARLIDDLAPLIGVRTGSALGEHLGAPAKPPESIATARVRSAPGTSLDGPTKQNGPPKRKRSTVRGEGREKLIAALTAHHKYADSGCLNLEPVGNNELARMAEVSPSTAKLFFDDQFRGLGRYKVLCSDAGRLSLAMKLLNNEVAPHHVLGDTDREVAEEGGPDD